MSFKTLKNKSNIGYNVIKCVFVYFIFIRFNPYYFTYNFYDIFKILSYRTVKWFYGPYIINIANKRLVT